MNSKQKNKAVKEKRDSDPESACSLCGRLYHNFSFKGGYICEDCLNSIKEQDQDQTPDTCHDSGGKDE